MISVSRRLLSYLCMSKEEEKKKRKKKRKEKRGRWGDHKEVNVIVVIRYDLQHSKI